MTAGERTTFTFRRGTDVVSPYGPGFVIRKEPGWVIVRCPSCGKVLCEAQVGSVVRKRCDRCKQESVTHIVTS